MNNPGNDFPESSPAGERQQAGWQQRADSTVTIPVIQEEVQLSKELLETGTVRVLKSTRQTEEIVHATLLGNTIEIERVPCHQVVESEPAVRVEGNVTIIPVVKEFLIVTKQLRLVEEIRVTNQRTTAPFQQPVVLRSDEVVVQRVEAGDYGTPGGETAGALEFKETTERAIVTKVPRVVEEVSVSTEVLERVETIHETVRRSSVEVEELDRAELEVGEKSASSGQ